MASDEIQVDYEALNTVVHRFERLSEQYQTAKQQLKGMVESLESGEWIGRGAETFYEEMYTVALPSLARLENILEKTAFTINQIAHLIREAEQNAANLFEPSGGMTNNRNPSFVGDILDRLFGGGDNKGDDSPHGSSQSFLSQHTSGTGWTFMSNEGFEAHEYLEQIGGSCTIYGAMNLLVQSGVDISQAEADAILARISEEYGRSEAFPIDAAKSILDEYGVSYEHGNFNKKVFGIDPFGLLGNDENAAKQFLVDQIKQGNSIYVTTEVDDSFGIDEGAHAYTVVGVQQDDNGNVTNVLVSTNWGNYQQIPIDGFVKDWMEFKDGEYIILK